MVECKAGDMAGRIAMTCILRTVISVGIIFALAACTHNGKTFPNFQFIGDIIPENPPALRLPVLPEMLVNCRGHVFVPALGMKFVERGREPPEKGQYLREDRLTPPYRVIPFGAYISQEQSPTRLNVELDKLSRVIGLFCG